MEQEVAQFIADLKHPDEYQRLSAAENLGDMRAGEAVDPLVQALEDPARSVMEAASESLVTIGTEKVAEATTQLLESDDPTVRSEAASILVQLDETAVPTLNRLLSDKDHDLRQYAVDALAEINSPRAIPSVLRALDDPNENVAAAAAEALGKLGNEEAIQPILRQLNRSHWMRGACLRALGAIGTEEALNAILEAAKDSEPVVLFSVIQALAKADSLKGIPTLIKILEKEPETYGEEAIIALKIILHHHSGDSKSSYLQDVSLEPIYDAARSGNVDTRLNAIKLLSNFLQQIPFSFLVQFYSDPEAAVRRSALNVVVQLAPTDTTPLVEILQSTQSPMEAKAGALDTLGRLKHPNSLQHIVPFLDSDDITLQRVALNALFPPIDQAVCDKMKELLNSPITEIQVHTLMAIERLQDMEFFEQVIQMLNDDDIDVVDAADAALVAIVEKINPHYPFLACFSQDERRKAFQHFNTGNADAISAQLVEALEHKDEAIRSIAIKALANTNPIESLPMIRKALEDPEKTVVIAAIAACGCVNSPETRSLLEEFLVNTANPHYITEAVLALGHIGQSSSISCILPHLKHPDTYTKLATIEALQTIGGSQALKALQELYLEEVDPEVIDVLEQALEVLEETVEA